MVSSHEQGLRGTLKLCLDGGKREFHQEPNSFLKKSERKANPAKDGLAGAEARLIFADLIGPAEAVPLLQSQFIVPLSPMFQKRDMGHPVLCLPCFKSETWGTRSIVSPVPKCEGQGAPGTRRKRRYGLDLPLRRTVSRGGCGGYRVLGVGLRAWRLRPVLPSPWGRGRCRPGPGR
jgi:hypothetical protein